LAFLEIANEVEERFFQSLPLPILFGPRSATFGNLQIPPEENGEHSRGTGCGKATPASDWSLKSKENSFSVVERRGERFRSWRKRERVSWRT